MTKIAINAGRLWGELQELARITEAQAPAVTRVVFTPHDRQARQWLRDRCQAAGLALREDAIGNVFARWEGTEPSLPPVVTGSHTDAIPNAGAYDGTVGVLGGLEALRALREAGFQPRRSLEVLMFTSEEPTRFGIGCLGSRLMARAALPAKVDLLRDAEGKTVREAAREAGYSGALEEVAVQEGAIGAFIELHIEQGPLLEKEKIEIGVVTAIAAPASMRIGFEGEGGHAGTVLMPERRDALCGAAELVLAVEAAGRAGSADTVATTGVLRPFPGAINSVPSKALLEIDVRDVAQAPRDAAVERILTAAAEIGQRRQLNVRAEMINADPPATSSPVLLQAIEDSCRHQGRTFRRMPSRAYHDSLFMARLCPTAMIFIPCRGGVSHRPDEYSTPESVAQGTAVLAEALAILSHTQTL